MMKLVRDSGFGHIIHECPYTVNLNVSIFEEKNWNKSNLQDLYVKHAFPMMPEAVKFWFPTGDYKAYIKVYTGHDMIEYGMIHGFRSVMSPEKNSFG